MERKCPRFVQRILGTVPGEGVGGRRWLGRWPQVCPLSLLVPVGYSFTGYPIPTTLPL